MMIQRAFLVAMCGSAVLSGGLIGGLSSSAVAQQQPMPQPSQGAAPSPPQLRIPSVTAAAPSANSLLGDRFNSPAAGIALNPPAGSKAVRGAIGSAEVVSFVNEEKNWVVKLNRVLLEQAMAVPLTAWKDPRGVEHKGMLESVVEQFRIDRPGAVFVREPETIDLLRDARRVGVMAARFTFGLEAYLTQQAVVRVDDRQYYILAMTSPAPREGEISEDPAVQRAVATFAEMVESIELLDQEQIRLDQEERLFRTRTLLLYFSEARLRQAIRREQWLRYLKDGKDVGYSYVVEEIARDLPRKGRLEVQTGPEGVLVGVRSRMMPEPGVQNDAEVWLFSSFDRKYEAFSSVAYMQDPRLGATISGEVGASRQREKPVLLGPPPDPNAPVIGRPQRPITLTDEYRLEVTKVGPNVSSDPIVRELPPYYMPLAIGQMLPRLVSQRDPKTYLFAVWVSDAGQVMYRYIDVQREEEVNLGGRRVRAIPVKDRIGLEGSITTHYISADGNYLGSINEDSRIMVLASDAATIERTWKDANLTRPGDVEQARPAN